MKAGNKWVFTKIRVYPVTDYLYSFSKYSVKVSAIRLKLGNAFSIVLSINFLCYSSYIYYFKTATTYRVHTGFVKFWKVMEIQIAIFHYLESFRKKRI